MAARGHFVFPIDAKNYRVLVIWLLNGFGEYEFAWCICDKVMACRSIGVQPKTLYPRNFQINFMDIIIDLFSLVMGSVIL